MTEEWMEILRKKLHWMEGFSAAIDNKHLQTWVNSFRMDLNRIEADKQPLDNSVNGIRSRREQFSEVKDASH